MRCVGTAKEEKQDELAVHHKSREKGHWAGWNVYMLGNGCEKRKQTDDDAAGCVQDTQQGRNIEKSEGGKRKSSRSTRNERAHKKKLKMNACTKCLPAARCQPAGEQEASYSPITQNNNE